MTRKVKVFCLNNAIEVDSEATIRDITKNDATTIKDITIRRLLYMLYYIYSTAQNASDVAFSYYAHTTQENKITRLTKLGKNNRQQ